MQNDFPFCSLYFDLCSLVFVVFSLITFSICRSRSPSYRRHGSSSRRRRGSDEEAAEEDKEPRRTRAATAAHDTDMRVAADAPPDHAPATAAEEEDIDGTPMPDGPASPTED